MGGPQQKPTMKRRGRWDMTTGDGTAAKKQAMMATAGDTPSEIAQPTTPVGGDSTPATLQMWDATPGHRDPGSETPSQNATARMWDPTPAHQTPGHGSVPGAETPGHISAATPGRRNRWDETPRTERETPGHGAG